MVQKTRVFCNCFCWWHSYSYNLRMHECNSYLKFFEQTFTCIILCLTGYTCWILLVVTMKTADLMCGYLTPLAIQICLINWVKKLMAISFLSVHISQTQTQSNDQSQKKVRQRCLQWNTCMQVSSMHMCTLNLYPFHGNTKLFPEIKALIICQICKDRSLPHSLHVII